MESIANGQDPIVQKAASEALFAQDACNIVGLAGAFHRLLLDLKNKSEAGADGDELINHPVTLAFVSKFNSLCRMNTEREMSAMAAIFALNNGETVNYDVIPL